MIAKLIVWGEDRAEALARMAQALSEYQIVGLANNIPFLQRLIASQAFSSADLDTGLIERNTDALFPPPAPVSVDVLTLAAVALVTSEKSSAANDPFADTGGWRMNSVLQRTLHFADAALEDAEAQPLTVAYQPDGWQIGLGAASVKAVLGAHGNNDFSLTLEQRAVRGSVVRDADVFHVFTGGAHTALNYNDPLAHAGEAEVDGGRLTAPMPGKVVAVLVKAGQKVKKGDPLVIMEAMKMEHTIAAPGDGVVEEVLYAIGDQVADGAPLLAFKLA